MAIRIASFLTVLAVAQIGAGARAGQATDFRCDYTRKILCDASGCKADPIGSAYLLLPNVRSMVTDTVLANSGPGLPTIRQCDSKGCDPVVVRAWLNGAFVDITQADRSYFIKIATIDFGADQGVRLGDFVEVATVMVGTVTYFGSCKAALK